LTSSYAYADSAGVAFAPKMPLIVRWRYIGAYTSQTCEKRDAWALATAISSGSIFRFATAVFW